MLTFYNTCHCNKKSSNNYVVSACKPPTIGPTSTPLQTSTNIHLYFRSLIQYNIGEIKCFWCRTSGHIYTWKQYKHGCWIFGYNPPQIPPFEILCGTVYVTSKQQTWMNLLQTNVIWQNIWFMSEVDDEKQLCKYWVITVTQHSTSLIVPITSLPTTIL